MRLAIFGCGGMGREVADIALRLFDRSDIVFVADEPSGDVQGIPVMADVPPGAELCFGIGSSAARKMLDQRFAGHRFATVISPAAIVSPSARIGEGSVICDLAMVKNSAVVGRHFQGNAFSQVSHDCIIGDFVTFSPRVSCNGWVHIEDDVFVGAGAVIRNGDSKRRLHIGAGAVIGMGAIVTKDVPAGVAVVGNPARAMA